MINLTVIIEHISRQLTHPKLPFCLLLQKANAFVMIPSFGCKGYGLSFISNLQWHPVSCSNCGCYFWLVLCLLERSEFGIKINLVTLVSQEICGGQSNYACSYNCNLLISIHIFRQEQCLYDVRSTPISNTNACPTVPIVMINYLTIPFLLLLHTHSSLSVRPPPSQKGSGFPNIWYYQGKVIVFEDYISQPMNRSVLLSKLIMILNYCICDKWVEKALNQYLFINFQPTILMIEERYFSSGNEPRYKIIMVGDPAVGKTTLFWRYIQGQFLGEHPQSVTAIDFKIKQVKIGGKAIKLFIWDTAGQQKYRAIVSSYFNGSQGVMVVFDLNKPDSYISATTKWFQIAKSKSPDAEFMLIGNKCDLPVQVNEREARQWCRKNNVRYIKTSVKNDINVSQCYKIVSEAIHQREIPAQKSKSFTLRKKELQCQHSKQKKCC